MTPSQTRSIERIRHFITEQCLNKEARYGDTIVKFDVSEEFKYFVSVTVQTDMIGLPETNMLRILSGHYWLFTIGKKGKITVKMCERSYNQFDGKEAFGMTFDL